jgi:hypothetical protein
MWVPPNYSSLVVGGRGVSGTLTLGILHHCYRCLDAASCGLRKGRRRIGGTLELLGARAESLGAWWRYAQNMSGAVITGAFVMASVGAFQHVDEVSAGK